MRELWASSWLTVFLKGQAQQEFLICGRLRSTLFSALLPLIFAEFPGSSQVLGGGRQSTILWGTL